MAIRDRVTITTKLGEKIVVQATKAGGSVEYERGREWTTMREVGQNSRTVFHQAEVQTSEIVSIVKDTEPFVSARAKAPRKPK